MPKPNRCIPLLLSLDKSSLNLRQVNPFQHQRFKPHSWKIGLVLSREMRSCILDQPQDYRDDSRERLVFIRYCTGRNASIEQKAEQGGDGDAEEAD